MSRQREKETEREMKGERSGGLEEDSGDHNEEMPRDSFLFLLLSLSLPQEEQEPRLVSFCPVSFVLSSPLLSLSLSLALASDFRT